MAGTKIWLFGAGLGLAALVTSLGCATVFPSLDQRSPEEKKDHAYRRCDEGDTKTWDLGIGRLPDIQRKAPDFYDFRSDSAYKNERRLYLLKGAQLPKGLKWDIRTEPYEGLSQSHVVEFGPKSPPSRLIGFTARKNGELTGGMLLIAAECPHVIVHDRCVDDHLQVEIEAQEPVACVNERSGQFWVRFGDAPARKIDPNVPVFFDYDQLSTPVTFLVGEDELFRDRLHRVEAEEAFASATPDTVTALLKFGDDMAASTAYAQMEASWKTSEFNAKVKELRVAAAASSFAGSPTPIEVIRKVEQIQKDAQWPGTDAVLEAIRPKMVSAFDELARNGNSQLAFAHAVMLLRMLSPNKEGLNLKTFETRYGQALLDGTLVKEAQEQERMEGIFVGLFPESSFVSQIQVRRARATADAVKLAAQEAEVEKKEAAKERALAEREAAKQEAEEKKQCLGQCRVGCTGYRVTDKGLCNKGCELRCSGDECAASCAIGCSSFKIDDHATCFQSCKAGQCQ